MSAEAALCTRSWSVGHRTVTMTLQRPKRGVAINACMEWSPSIPGHLSVAEWAQYRSGRDVALVQMSAALGVKALGVVEV